MLYALQIAYCVYNTFILFLKAKAPFPLDGNAITARILKFKRLISVSTFISTFASLLVENSMKSHHFNF
jgi:hypothetical protein